MTNKSSEYLVFRQIQQYLPPWNNFLHLTKAMLFILYIFRRFSTVSRGQSKMEKTNKPQNKK